MKNQINMPEHENTSEDRAFAGSNSEPLPEPTGKFVVENATGIQLEDGIYYHYADVCRLLGMSEQENIRRDLINVPGANPCLYKIWVTEDDMEALKIIRYYFIKDDKPGLNMLAAEVLSRIVTQVKNPE